MGNCTRKPKTNDIIESYSKSMSSPSVESGSEAKVEANKKSTEEEPNTPNQVGKLLLKQPGYTDKFVEYHLQGHSIRKLMRQYKAPSDWNRKLRDQYRLGNFQTTNSQGDQIYTRIIHLNDSLDSTKRHFLTFYDLDLTQIYPPDFMKWCTQNQMYNTCSDFMSLYIISRFQGHGSRILRTLLIDPRSMAIEMSDRFQMPTGWYRAIKFSSTSRKGVQWMVNAFMTRLDPQTYRSVRCDKQSYVYCDEDQIGITGFEL